MNDARLPPQNIEAEMHVLGSILIDEDAILKIGTILRPDHFYDKKNKDLYSAMMGLLEKGSPIDHLLLKEELKAKNLLKKGYPSYIIELAELVPSSGMVEHYANLVREASMRRKLISASANINASAFDPKIDFENILDEAERQIFQVSESSIQKDFLHISDLLVASYERAEQMAKNKGELRGIKSGFKSLDGMLGGFHKSDMVILGARPAVGKTSFSLDLARHMAVDEKKSVVFFSLEMSANQLIDRVISMQTGIGLWDLRTSNIKSSQLDKLADAMGKLSECNIYIDDTPGVNITQIRTKCRRLKLEKGLDVIFIDYLQLITGNNKENRVQEVSDISRQLKIIARELDVPVIALSQLSRAVESRTDRRPQLSDLRESGSIEQDADIVMFLHREDMYNQDAAVMGKAEIIIAKHRNGPTGEIPLTFVKEQARYRESNIK
jgi:replicative DNA helicase